MASSRERMLAPSPPFAVYSANMLRIRLERMLSHLEGVRIGGTTQPVHQMRVWCRRTRTALEIYQSANPDKRLATMNREIKRMADALGEARDLDVMIDNLQHAAGLLPEQQRPGVEEYVEDLKDHRHNIQDRVARAAEDLEIADVHKLLMSILGVTNIDQDTNGAVGETGG